MVNKLFYLFFIFILFSCSTDKLEVNTSEVKIDLKHYNSLPQLMISNPNALWVSIQKSKLTYPELMDYQLGYCLQIQSNEDTTIINALQTFQKDPYIQRLQKELTDHFQNTQRFETKIDQGFLRLKAFMPETKTPQSIVYMNTLFNASVFCTEKEIGVGMERYLGKDNPLIQELPGNIFFDWIKNGFDEKYLPSDVFNAWISTHLIPEKEGNLAENMIRWGKIIYLTKAALPEEKEEVLLRYSNKNFDWALKNERLIWEYLVEENFLFKVNAKTNANFLNDAPFTSGLPEKGPDRLGRFLGYRMVLKYMELSETKVSELINIPYTEILQEYEIED